MATPKVLVLRAAGTNCDEETALAFKLSGGSPTVAHVNRLADKSVSLEDFQILAIPGGFSYGDDIMAGRVFAVELEHRLGDGLKDFVARGGLVIGICNGFQVLVKTGILPGNSEFPSGGAVTLAANNSLKYEDRWVNLQVEDTNCVWLKEQSALIELPIAHAEGRFLTKTPEILDTLKTNNQIVLRYVNSDRTTAEYPANPNGATEGIAGVCDVTGQVLGLMPHPERYIFEHHHPLWTRGEGNPQGDGRIFFENAVKALS